MSRACVRSPRGEIRRHQRAQAAQQTGARADRQTSAPLRRESRHRRARIQHGCMDSGWQVIVQWAAEDAPCPRCRRPQLCRRESTAMCDHQANRSRVRLCPNSPTLSLSPSPSPSFLLPPLLSSRRFKGTFDRGARLSRHNEARTSSKCAASLSGVGSSLLQLGQRNPSAPLDILPCHHLPHHQFGRALTLFSTHCTPNPMLLQSRCIVTRVCSTASSMCARL